MRARAVARTKDASTAGRVDGGSPSRSGVLLARLSRRTSTGRYIPEVDGVRFVAIALVLLFHAYVLTHVVSGSATVAEPFGNATEPHPEGVLQSIAAQGRYGVHLFFVISGFILALPFASYRLGGDRPVSLRRYYLRRLTRLEPPYLLALLLSFVAAVVLLGLEPGRLMPTLLPSLFYQHGPVQGEPSLLNGAFWSLEVEVQFYLIAPVLASLFLIRDAARRRLILVIAFLATLVLQFVVVAGSSRLTLSLANYLDLFLVGFFVADVYVTEWSSGSSGQRKWDVVGLAALGALFGRSLLPDTVFGVSLPLLAGLILCAALRGRLTRRALANRWIITVGGMCYSIYLLHYPVMVVIREWSDALLVPSFALRFMLQSVVAIPAAVGVGLALFVMVERPCMDPRWPGKVKEIFLRRWRPAEARTTVGPGFARRRVSPAPVMRSGTEV